MHPFGSPFVVGWIKESTGSADKGLYVIGACLVSAAIALILLRSRFAARSSA